MPDFVDDARANGYSDDEISNYLAQQRETAKAAGYDDHQINDYLTGVNMPRTIPTPFLERFAKGFPNTSFVVKQATDAFNASGPSVTPEDAQQLRDWGIWNDPAKGQTSFLRFANEALMRTAASGVSTLMSGINAGIAGAGAIAAQQATGLPAPEKTANEMAQLGGIAAILLGTAPYAGPISKPHLGAMGEVSDLNVGNLPTHQTVVDAAKALGGPEVPIVAKDKLVSLYENKGLHPAEVVDDASRDPVVRQNMLSLNKDLPYEAVPVSAGNVPGEVPIVRFRKDAAAIEATLPPAEEGTTRLWRGNRPGEVGTARQFTNDLPGIALPFREPYGGDISYVDVPTADLAKYENKTGAAPGAEFSLPADVASQAKPVRVEPTPAAAATTAPAPRVSTLTEAAERPPLAEGGAGGPPELPPPPGRPELPPPPEVPPPGGEQPLLEGPPPSTTIGAPLSYEDARKDVLDRLSIAEPETRRPSTFGRLYTNFIDRLFPLSRATIRAAGKLDEPLSTASNPEHLARLLSGSAGKANHMLRYATFDFDTYANNGPSLESILEPIRGPELDDFRAYVAASRAVELDQRGIETGIPLNAAERVVDEGFDKYAGIHGQLVDYQNRVAQYLRDSGVVSQKGYDAMVAANQNYVPFFRLIDEEEGFRGPTGSLQATNPIRRIKGADSRIIDPIESIVKNTFLYTQMAERNAVGTELVDLLKRANETKIQEVPLWADRPAAETYLRDLGVKNPEDLMAFVQTAAQTPEGDTIAVLRNGQRETYRVDPELARAFKGLDRDTMNALTRLLQIPARYLRAGAVLTPDFMARHLLRDFQYAVITSKGLFSPQDMARGFAGLISKNKDYQNWLKSGGANISINAIDRNYIQESIADLTRSTGLGVRAQNVVDLLTPQMDFASKDIVKQLLHPLQVSLDVAQSATHLGAFVKKSRRLGRDLLPGEELTKQMIQEAGYESRATGIDPARIGASMTAWNAITAFGNIALQDTDRIVRAFKDRPMTTAIKIAGAMTLPSVLLWAANHDDPDWKEIVQWQKDLFWIIPAWRETGADGQLHKVFFRAPKPWATGLLFASLPERLLQNFLTDRPTSVGSFFRSLSETTGIGLKAFTPTGFSPILDQFSNENLFSGRTLIPQAVEKFLPEYRYQPYTTELAKRLGQSIAPFAGPNASPILIENYIQGWTGTLGKYVLDITDQSLRKQGVIPDPPKPTSTLADNPFVRAFAIRYPSATTQSIEDFNTEYRDSKQYFDTFMAKAKEGDQEALTRIQAAGGPRIFVQLDAIHQAMMTEQQTIQNIYKNPSMKPEEKRQLIDQLYFEMIDVARQGRIAQRAITQQLRP